MDAMKTKKSVMKSPKRFLRSQGRKLEGSELREKGRVVMVEMGGVENTIGSQFLITIDADRALEGLLRVHDMNRTGTDDGSRRHFLSLGRVVEDDDNALSRINAMYCDEEGRPYADVRIVRTFALDDPFEDPLGFQELLKHRDLSTTASSNTTESQLLLSVAASPTFERPPEELVEVRISARDIRTDLDDSNNDGRPSMEDLQREEQIQRKEDRSRAVVLEMLGDLPSAGE